MPGIVNPKITQNFPAAQPIFKGLAIGPPLCRR